jgi:hypothetical protein
MNIVSDRESTGLLCHAQHVGRLVEVFKYLQSDIDTVHDTPYSRSPLIHHIINQNQFQPAFVIPSTNVDIVLY